MNVNDLIYPEHKYQGFFSQPEELVFNSNFQEFSRRVEIITALNTGGNLTAKQTFTRIRKLYEQLKKSEEGLGIDILPQFIEGFLPASRDSRWVRASETVAGLKESV